MIPPTCPRCSQVDQVRSAQGIYATQTGVHHSTGFAGGGVGLRPVVMATSSQGTQASHLALQLAPPPAPRYVPALSGGHIVAFLSMLGIGVAGVLTVKYGGHSASASQNHLTGLAMAIIGFGLIPVLIISIARHARSSRRRFAAYQAVWPALMHTWQNAMVCQRCYVAFFPPGALPVGPGPGELIPIPAFQAAVHDIGARLVSASMPSVS